MYFHQCFKAVFYNTHTQHLSVILFVGFVYLFLVTFQGDAGPQGPDGSQGPPGLIGMKGKMVSDWSCAVGPQRQNIENIVWQFDGQKFTLRSCSQPYTVTIVSLKYALCAGKQRC